MEVNITQFLDIKSQPFRRAALDYSHLLYADALDAIAATIIMTALTGLLMHLITSLYGMSTRSLSMKSLYGGSFPSDVFQILSMFLRKKNPKRKLHLAPRFISFTLLLILLFAEALLLLSQSNTIEGYNLEELYIRKPKVKPFVGKPFLSTLSHGCTPLIQSRHPIWYSPLDLCISHPFVERYVPRMEEVDGAMSITVDMEYEKGEVFFMVTTADYGYSFELSIELQGSPSGFTKMNSTYFISDPEELLAFLIDSAAELLGCAGASDMWLKSPTSGSLMFNRFIFNCSEVDEERFLIGKGLVLSSLSLSEESITANDFYSVFPANGSAKRIPITRSTLDDFASREVARIRGFVLWVVAIALLMTNLVFSCIAPDLEFAKSTAVAQYLNCATIPISASQHIYLPSKTDGESGGELD
ncbi:hypothetical protein FGB62_90g04 [Gracilaria domingensis]|nr:hypothetical protein FGB62_90g04 [Gracilaria domingensis]